MKNALKKRSKDDAKQKKSIKAKNPLALSVHSVTVFRRSSHWKEFSDLKRPNGINKAMFVKKKKQQQQKPM